MFFPAHTVAFNLIGALTEPGVHAQEFPQNTLNLLKLSLSLFRGHNMYTSIQTHFRYTYKDTLALTQIQNTALERTFTTLQTTFQCISERNKCNSTQCHQSLKHPSTKQPGQQNTLLRVWPPHVHREKVLESTVSGISGQP